MRKVYTFLLLAICCAPAWATPALVQHANNNSTTNAATLAITTSSTSNKLLVVIGAKGADTDSISSVTDNQSNTYTQATSALGTLSSVMIDVWYCLNATSGVTTVTIHWATTSTANKQGEVYEFSGFTTPVFDLANHGSAAAVANVITGASVTTTATVGVIVAGSAAGQGTIDQNPNSGNSFTAGGDILAGGQISTGMVSKISSSASAQNATWHNTTATANEVNTIAAFKESASPGVSVGSPFVITP